MKNFREHFLFWILPTVVTLLCIVLYFFDSLGLSHMISPPSNREFGILENLQLLLILITLIISINAIRLKENKTEKYLFTFIAVFSVFLLLEEIDYGLHFYELFSNEKSEPVIRNIHNNGKITSHFKMMAYVFIVIFFVVLPFVPQKFRSRYQLLEYISPAKGFITTAISLFVLNQLAFYFYHQDVHANRSLNGNVSEFEELMIYYLIMLYIKELADPAKRLPVLLR